jgi:hypothetical protein
MGAAGLTERVRFLLATTGVELDESATSTVKENDPDAVGSPDRSPDGLSERPAGKVPDEIDQL